jgi:hypothetical protein
MPARRNVRLSRCPGRPIVIDITDKVSASNIYVFAYLCVSVCMHVCECVCVHVCACVCMCVCVCVCKM